MTTKRASVACELFRKFLLLVAALLLPTAADAVEPGDILVAEGTQKAVVSVNPRTQEMSVVSSGGLLTNVSDVAVSPDGTIFALNADPPLVIRIDPTTGDQVVLADGRASDSFVSATRLDCIPSGQLIVTGYTGITGIDAVTGVQQLLVPSSAFIGLHVYDVVGIAFSQSGQAYSANNAERCEGGVSRVDLERGTAALRCAASGYGCFVNDMASTNGLIIFSTFGPYASPLDLYAVAGGGFGCGGFRNFAEFGIMGIGSVCASPRGTFIVAGGDGTVGKLFELDPVSRDVVLIASGREILSPAGVAVYPDTPTATKPIGWGQLMSRYRKR